MAYPENREGWGQLCRLLTLGKRRAQKGNCLLYEDDLLAHLHDLVFIIMPTSEAGDHAPEHLAPFLQRLGAAASGSVWLGAAMTYRGHDRRRVLSLSAIADAAGMPLIATNDVLYHAPTQRPLQDIVTCIREGVKLEQAGRRLQANAERHLKPSHEMARLFRDCPHALTETQNLLARIDFSLDQLSYNYPDEPVPPGKTPQRWLEELTWRHAAFRYPGGIPDKVTHALEDELKLIAELDYAPYFLTIHDIVRVANDKNILCQGRGSAANSAVCYVLGITAVNPAEHDLLFARFISSERREPPDIDVDFEHERREEIIQHIYERYGRERAGIAATVIRYRPRSALREVGKVLGLTEDVTARLSGTIWGSHGRDVARKHIRDTGLDPDNPVIAQVIDLSRQLLGFPRHLSQHVGGFILTRDRLDDIVPIGNAAMADRTFIEWDKDDIDVLKLMKVDILALGMLTCIRKCLDLMKAHCGIDYALADVPREDACVYDMLCRGDSVGVFQVESRAQINMLPRLRPREFYDLVIQVAIVRPGPILGDMVHPYLRRRNGEEKVSYPSPGPEHGPADELEQVLKRTLGVPLFQEHAMKIAMVAARFSAEEANKLRRAMATFRHVGTIHTFEQKMIDGMVKRGYVREFAERCFNQIKGFGEYGFPESHAASFAKLVYISSWIKCHHPAVFACGLLNAQPMGFYAPAQIVRDAREHGVEVRPADINHSAWDNSLERNDFGIANVGLALRLGLRQIDGMQKAWGDALVTARAQPPDAQFATSAGFESVEDLWRRAKLPHRALKLLADADAFRSIGLDRRNALWAVRRLPDDVPLPLFDVARSHELADEPEMDLPDMPLVEHVVADYQTLRLSLKAHPMALLRRAFDDEGILTCRAMIDEPDGAFVRVAGVVLIRQRPGKGNAIFMTLEDETGVANAVLWARKFESFRPVVMGAKLALVHGHVQKSKEGVIHLMASSIHDRTVALQSLSDLDGPPFTPAHADEVIRPQQPRGTNHPRNVRVIPKSRDFH
jgi:error-prone DNA polymerase